MVVVSISLKNLIGHIKSGVKRFFGWIHLKLTNLENRILKWLDEKGKKMGEKLEFRLNGDSDDQG
jgi:hypothetical protein